ncbi:MAG: GNAT family N-acetyltransferase [Muribaculaceae bacterium]
MNDVIIRNAVLADAEDLLGIYAPYVLNTAVTFEYDVPSVDEFARRVAAISAKYPYLVAECGGTIVGYAYASVFKDRAAYQWSVETSIYLRPDVHRRGIGTKLYEALEQRLKEQGILNMNACISYPVAAADPYLTLQSVQFHERMGFARVAHFHKCGLKFGRWYDMVWMERLIGEHK